MTAKAVVFDVCMVMSVCTCACVIVITLADVIASSVVNAGVFVVCMIFNMVQQHGVSIS